MEELIYWGIIFLFYLFSAYRSRQKKVEAEEFQVVEPSPQTENRNSRTDFNNIFEFLDEAMEKSALNLDDDLASKINQHSNDDLPVVITSSIMSTLFSFFSRLLEIFP